MAAVLPEIVTIVVLFVLITFLSPFLVVIAVLGASARKLASGVGFTSTNQRVAIYDHSAPDRIRVIDNGRRPSLKRGHCVVKIHSAGVNPVDAKSLVGDKFPESWMPFWFRVFTGQSVGFDFSGEVAEAGTDSRFKPGDLVFGLNYQYLPGGLGKFGGTLQQFALVPEHEMWEKPSSLSHNEAAALPLVGLTCLQAFEQHNLRAGQRLLVVGASGGVGHVATAIASRLGVKVTGVCSTAKVAFVKSCGAKTVLDYRASTGIFEQLDEDVAKHGMYDMIFDTVSSADSRDREANYEQRIRARTPPIIKMAHVNAEPDVDAHNYVVFGGTMVCWWRALVKRLTRKAGCTVDWFPRGFETFWIDMPHSTRYLKALKDICDEKGMRPLVSEALPFTDEGCQAAFHKLNPPKTERRSASGKIIIEVASPTS